MLFRSEGSSRVVPSYGVVSSAKAALESHVRQLAMEFARLDTGVTANAIQRTVHCGPVEGTAIGNMLIQAIAMGHLKGLADLRQVVRQSFPLKTYAPQDALTWQKAYERFQKLP